MLEKHHKEKLSEMDGCPLGGKRRFCICVCFYTSENAAETDTTTLGLELHIICKLEALQASCMLAENNKINSK